MNRQTGAARISIAPTKAKGASVWRSLLECVSLAAGIRSFETDRGRALRSACIRTFRRSALLQQAFGAVRFVFGDVVCVGDRLRIGFRRSVRRHAGRELCPHQMPPQNQQVAADTLSCRVSDFFRVIQNLRESGACKQADCRRRGHCIFLRMYLRAARAFYQGTEISSYR